MTHDYRMFHSLLLLLPLAAPALECPPFCDEQTAEIRVIDGDTFEYDGTRIRLWGIDAPELHDSCGNVPIGELSKSALQGIVSDGSFYCDGVDTDRYGRTVAACFIDHADVAASMVSLGWAEDWPRYSEGKYAARQAMAKHRTLGVWGCE